MTVESRTTVQVKSFTRRYGRGHLELAVHAALPLVLTPELLHLLRLNFTPLLPWYAEADLLLSPLCAETAAGYYEMQPEIRDYLLDELREAPQYGVARLEELASFLEAYASREMRRGFGDPALPFEFYESLRWTARAYLNPSKTAHDLVSAMARATSEDDKATLIRLGGMTTSLISPLVGQENLAFYATGINYLLGENTQAASQYFTLLEQDGSPTVAGQPAPGFKELTGVLQPNFTNIPVDLSRFPDEQSLQAEIEALQSRLSATSSVREKLRLQRELEQLQAELNRRQVEEPASPDSPPGNKVRLAFNTPRLEVARSAGAEVTLTLTNLSEQLERYQLQVEDLSPDWFQLDTPELLLYPDSPGNEATILLSFSIPLDASPGDYSPVISVLDSNSKIILTEKFSLVVLEQSASATVSPDTGPNQTQFSETLLSPSLRWLLPEKRFGTSTQIIFKDNESGGVVTTPSNLSFEFTVVNNSELIDFYTVTFEEDKPGLFIDISPSTFSLRPGTQVLAQSNAEEPPQEAQQVVMVGIRPGSKATPGSYVLSLRLTARSSGTNSVYIPGAVLVELKQQSVQKETSDEADKLTEPDFSEQLTEQQHLLQEAVLSNLLKFSTNTSPIEVQNELVRIEYQPHLVVEPGGYYLARLTLLNLGNVAETYYLKAQDTYASWFSIDRSELNLFPNWSESLELRVIVPPGTPVGYYYPIFQVNPASDSEKAVGVTFMVQVVQLPVLPPESQKLNLEKLIELREQLTEEITNPSLQVTGMVSQRLEPTNGELESYRIEINYLVTDREAKLETSKFSAELITPGTNEPPSSAVITASEAESTKSTAIQSSHTAHQAEWLFNATNRRAGFTGSYGLVVYVNKSLNETIVVRSRYEGEGRRNRQGFFDLSNKHYKVEFEGPQLLLNGKRTSG